MWIVEFQLNTIVYKFLITRLNDLHDQLHGSINLKKKKDLHNGYHQIRMRHGDKWRQPLNKKWCL